MKPNFKPKGYTSVSVYIMAADAQMVIDFLQATFDATETRRYETPDGGIMHAEVKIDDTIVMIADAGEDYPAFPVWMHVYVPDVDATFKRAITAGGTVVQDPVQKEGDPDKRGGISDPSGNIWWISTQIS